jgi:hypothetical protein
VECATATAASQKLGLEKSDMESDLWDLKFGIEVSARYHDWRRATIMGQIRFAKGVTFFGAIATLVTAFNPLHFGTGYVQGLLVFLSIGIAVVNLWELTAGWDALALGHHELYRRFAALRARMNKSPDGTNERLSDWSAEAAAIRADEPPTMWAIYTMCWNQTVERYHGKQADEHYRRVGWFRYLLGNAIQFRPHDFPLVQSGR